MKNRSTTNPKFGFWKSWIWIGFWIVVVCLFFGWVRSCDIQSRENYPEPLYTVGEEIVVISNGYEVTVSGVECLRFYSQCLYWVELEDLRIISLNEDRFRAKVAESSM